MPTKMNEASLEELIVNHLVNAHGYEQGISDDYDRDYALDTQRLEKFLRDTQPDLVRTSRIFDTPANRRKFLERVRKAITERGVVDVLRKGVKHLSNTFMLYCPWPSELSETAQATYAKNRFCAIRQLHYSKENRDLALDVCILLNGMPIITMELKNQLTCQNTQEAVAQYCKDRDAKDLLFMPKRCAVHFAADDDTVEMCTKLCGDDSWFLPFNKGYNDGAGNPVNPNGLKTAYLWEDILSKQSLSNILEHYAQVVVEVDEETKKKKEKIIWPRYHQLEVVRALLDCTNAGDVGQRFLIQHSAGSGKSNSITWLAYQLVEMLRGDQALFDSIILVTDRVNLDKQLRDNVKAFGHNSNIVDWANSSGKLKTHLENGKKIILTTVQKFSFILEGIGSELASKRFAVIIDEAHSSQSGKMSASTNQVLSGGLDVEDDPEDEGDEVEKKVNRAVKAFMDGRKMAPNANFYAFTATPKNKTLETFGAPFEKEDGEIGHRPFHTYTMKQAIEEGFILDVLKGYTTYKSYYRIRKTIEDDPTFDRVQSMKKLRYFVESQPETVSEKAKVMVEHFHNNVAHKIGGEARCMVVTAGIERAIDYFHEINKLLKERNSQYKAIVAFTGDVNYHGVVVNEFTLNNFSPTLIEKTFKKGMYRFLIVADKFQTGYDEPLLHTMYVDKPLHGVKTVQTLSRLNRKCLKKKDTCVLDFVNTTEEVEHDFQTFYKTTILSKETDPNKLNDLLDGIESYELYTEEEVELFTLKFWTNAPRTEIDPILDTCRERFCALDDDGKVDCKSKIKGFVRAYDWLSTVMPDNSIEWEKKSTFLALLLNKLPRLTMEDLTKGLLDAVDFDRYRLEKTEERDIQLQNVNVEIDPVPASGGGRLAEPDMQVLSTIESNFNELFGNIEWTDSDVVRAQIDEIVNKVVNDDVVRNSMLNCDVDTANQDCDQSTSNNMAIMTATHTELMKVYWQREDFRESINEMVRERVRNSINPEYNEEALKAKIRAEFREDFKEFCGGDGQPEFGEVVDIFFKIVNADTIPDLQGLRTILRHILNCVYRAQQREEDFRSWYADLVSRFEAFLKKIYYIREGHAMPLNAAGREAAFIETVSYFPKVSALYATQNPKLDMFHRFYNVVYNWRNNENHRALEISTDMLPTALHAAVALYLYTSMVSKESLEGKL